VCVFFFQAEDGIRDRNVTGVQTCALPIWFAHSPGVDVEEISKVAFRLRRGGGAQVGLLRLLPVTPDDDGLPVPIWVLQREREERSEERRVGKEERAGWARDH